MKITKRQLKQIIKEVISEAWDDNDDEWLTPDEMRKSPRSKMMGPSPIAGQEGPSDTEGGYTMDSEEEEENFRTVDYMISFYQEKPMLWDMAVNQYHEMAHGEDPDGIRSEMYPDWSDEDFAKVISAVSPRREEYREEY